VPPQSSHQPQLPEAINVGPLSLKASRWNTAILTFLLLWTFLIGCVHMTSFDIWWHLRTGQLILERGVLPQTDWFTYADWDKPWIDLHWGFQLIVTALHAAGGPELLVLVKAACLSATVAVGWLACGRGLPAWAKAMLWLLPAICLSGRALVRPEMLSLVFLAMWCWVLARVDERPRLIWTLPLLQVVWINCHALFVLGLVVGAAFYVDRAVREVAGGRYGLAAVDSKLRFGQLTIAAVLTVLASLANPYLERGALFPLVLYQKFSVDHDFYSIRIGEFQTPLALWRRIGFGNLYLLSEIALWLMTAVSFLWLARERRINIMRLLLFAGFSHLGWRAARNTNLLALIGGVVLCANCAEALALRRRRLSANNKPSRHAGASQPHSVGRLFNPIAVTLLVVLSLSVPTGYWSSWGGEGRRFGIGIDEAKYWYALGAARFAGQEGMPQTAFIATIGQAAPYAYYNAPKRRVFMDGRLEVATRATFERHELVRDMMDPSGSLFRPDAAWVELILDEEGHVPAVILDSRHARDQINGMLLTPSWRLVFADPAAAVFLDDSLAARLELPRVDPEPLYYPP